METNKAVRIRHTLEMLREAYVCVVYILEENESSLKNILSSYRLAVPFLSL